LPVAPTQSMDREFTPEYLGAGRVMLTPVAFFRGRFDKAPDGLALAHTDAVKVEVHGKESISRRVVGQRQPVWFKVADQFSKHPHTGYYHPAFTHDMAYWGKLTNVSPKRLALTVTQALGGSSTPTRGRLEPGQSTGPGEVGGEVIDDGKPKRLVVSVREGGADGRDLCEPFRVDFQEVDPRNH